MYIYGSGQPCYHTYLHTHTYTRMHARTLSQGLTLKQTSCTYTRTCAHRLVPPPSASVPSGIVTGKFMRKLCTQSNQWDASYIICPYTIQNFRWKEPFQFGFQFEGSGRLQVRGASHGLAPLSQQGAWSFVQFWAGPCVVLYNFE